MKVHHQEDISHNSTGRVDNTGALIASRGDKTGNHTTIHHSSYGNHDPLISGHDDNNTHHVRGRGLLG